MAESTTGALEKLDGRALDAAMETGAAGFQLKSMQDVFRYGQYVIDAGMAPACYKKPGQIVVAIQTGAETGLSPSASIRAIYVVPDSGTPSWTAEAMRGLVRRGFFDPWTRKLSPVLFEGTDLEEGVIHSHPETDLKKDCTPQCYGYMRSWPKLKNGQVVETRFTVGMAIQANLWEAKPNPKKNWRLYPFLMLQHRASSIHCRLNYGGVLLGLQGQDEAEDHQFSTGPRVRAGAIDVGDTKGTGDPLFTRHEPTVEAESTDTDPDLIVDLESPPVNDGPKEESAGPLFDQDPETQDRLATEQDQAPQEDEAPFCEDHLGGFVDGCQTCDEIQMNIDDNKRMDTDKQAAVLARLEAEDKK